VVVAESEAEAPEPVAEEELVAGKVTSLVLVARIAAAAVAGVEGIR
jgi:hypothetical protein